MADELPPKPYAYTCPACKKKVVVSPDVLPGVRYQPFTEGDEKAVEWAYESLRDTPKSLSDTLRQLTTCLTQAARLSGYP